MFTYSVEWETSTLAWASRWDTYLSMSNAQIHWFSILNSLVVVLFLAGVLAAIIIRTLKKDIANYNKLDEEMVGILCRPHYACNLDRYPDSTQTR